MSLHKLGHFVSSLFSPHHILSVLCLQPLYSLPMVSLCPSRSLLLVSSYSSCGLFIPRLWFPGTLSVVSLFLVSVFLYSKCGYFVPGCGLFIPVFCSLCSLLMISLFPSCGPFVPCGVFTPSYQLSVENNLITMR